MTWLGEWLKQVILIVMVSAIADMLLPTKATQKYVRAVLGVAIIAALIQPITPLMKNDWADHMANALTQELVGSPSNQQNASQNDTTSLYEHQLQTQTSQQTDKLVADAVLEALPADLRNDITSITVHHGENPSQLTATIHVNVTELSLRQQIQSTVANTLNITKDQVTVMASGGEPSGLETTNQK